MTLVKVYEDGAIRCAWDSWSSVEYDMSRDDVLIATTVLKSLTPVPPRIEAVERWWTDASGMFKVQATYISSQDGKVTLRKSDGVELSVAIEQLSAEDRKIVAQLAEDD